jgi:integrase
MGRIHVQVVAYLDCRNLVLRWRDPTTGKYRRTTKYRDPRTGEETETGTDRRAAKKLAALLERDLMAGLAVGPGSTGWQQFRDRYETEVVPALARRTGEKITVVFNAVEKALPRVANGRLADLTAEALSRLQADLRDGGRSENTIASYLAHLRAALAWAVDQGMILAIPKIRRPQRAKGGKGSKSKGRPITGEEFERMLLAIGPALAETRKRKRAVNRRTRANKGQTPRNTRTDDLPVEVNRAAVESWRHYLHGLWLSGLRLEESLALSWDRDDRPRVDLTGKRPMLRIPAECEKGNRDRVLPITPDFAEFLLRTKEVDRHRSVFRPIMPSGNLAGREQAGRMVALIGELARVKVSDKTVRCSETGKDRHRVKWASAHDLRRSFGNRWAKRVMPAVLQRLMRHESIETTLAYYVDLDANELAEDLYRAHEKAEAAVRGAISGAAEEYSRQAEQ